MSYQPDQPDQPPGRPVHPLEREPVPAPPPAGQVEAPAPPPGTIRRVTFPATTPVFTYILIAINVAVFLVDTVMAYTGMGFRGIGLLTLLGAKNSAAILDGEYWRLITPLFLHGGILHLGFNSYFLYIVGQQIERAYGRTRFLALYFVSGLAATIASFALSRADSIGASGALFGLIGAWIPLLYRNQHVLANTRRQIRSIIQVIAINLLIGLTPGIDNWAHLGGLAGGLVLGWFTTPRYAIRDQYTDHIRIEDSTEPLQAVLATVAFVILLGALLLYLIQART
ncbi:MAG TPA: rhomboid family intramembrane serine protease [Aggregatilineales bacterium]|nr:rhomboid family intramembrane serine protease [Aggregatilineales bacterium]